MTDAPYGGLPPADRPLGGSSTTDTAKDQATQVGQTAKESGQKVAGTAAEQSKHVLHEGKQQARNLTREVGQQAHEQTKAQKDKASSGLRSLADELDGMANGQGGPSGLATDLAQQASSKANELASWLDRREPGDLLDEVRRLARRKPGTFLLGALAAGVVAGRLTRGAVDANSDDTVGQTDTPIYAETVAAPTTQPHTGLPADDATVRPADRLDLPAGEYSNATAGGYR